MRKRDNKYCFFAIVNKFSKPGAQIIYSIYHMTLEFLTLFGREHVSFLASKISDVVFIILKNVKMSTLVGILTFMSMIYVMLS